MLDVVAAEVAVQVAQRRQPLVHLVVAEAFGGEGLRAQPEAAEDEHRTSHERNQHRARGCAPGGSCEDAGRRAEQKRLDPRHQLGPAEAERPELLPAQQRMDLSNDDANRPAARADDHHEERERGETVPHGSAD